MSINLSTKALDDLFGGAAEETGESVQYLESKDLFPNPENPYPLLSGDELEEIVASVKEQGILQPILARPRPQGGFEIISGHRRYQAGTFAKLTVFPVIVREMDDDTAAILLVDGNKQREKILPSVKARAIKMKYDAKKRKAGRPEGKGSAGRLDEEVAASMGMKKNTFFRYYRLNYLISELLQMVDNKELDKQPAMAMITAVELSHLSEPQQRAVLDLLMQEDCGLTLSHAQQIKAVAQDDKWEPEDFKRILFPDKYQTFAKPQKTIPPEQPTSETHSKQETADPPKLKSEPSPAVQPTPETHFEPPATDTPKLETEPVPPEKPTSETHSKPETADPPKLKSEPAPPEQPAPETSFEPPTTDPPKLGTVPQPPAQTEPQPLPKPEPQKTPVFSVISKEPENGSIQITITAEMRAKYFPPHYNEERIKNTIFKLLTVWKQRYSEQGKPLVQAK